MKILVNQCPNFFYTLNLNLFDFNSFNSYILQLNNHSKDICKWKDKCKNLISHALSHFFFFNLVTMLQVQAWKMLEIINVLVMYPVYIHDIYYWLLKQQLPN